MVCIFSIDILTRFYSQINYKYFLDKHNHTLVLIIMFISDLNAIYYTQHNYKYISSWYFTNNMIIYFVFTYIFQADVCHAYQILHKHGIPDERIVVMMYDDIADNRE